MYLKLLYLVLFCLEGMFVVFWFSKREELAAKLRLREAELLRTLEVLHADVRESPRVVGSKGSPVANPVLAKIAPLEREYRLNGERIVCAGRLKNFFTWLRRAVGSRTPWR